MAGLSVSRWAGLGAERVLVHRTVGDPAKQRVGFLLFFQSLMQQTRNLRFADQLGPCAKGAVAGDFVVLGGLARGYQAGIKHLRVVNFLDDFLAFLDDAENGVAFFPLAGLPMILNA